jgi:hypothetical protein
LEEHQISLLHFAKLLLDPSHFAERAKCHEALVKDYKKVAATAAVKHQLVVGLMIRL